MQRDSCSVGVQVKNSFVEAQKVSVDRPHAHVTEAPCPHFDDCGGCTLQTVEYGAQLDMKQTRLQHMLRNVPGIEGRQDLWRDTVQADHRYGCALGGHGVDQQPLCP